MKTTMLVVAALLSVSILAQTRSLANGVYAVMPGDATSKSVTIRHEDKDIALDTTSFTPLEGKPELRRMQSGNTWLFLQLTPDATKRLAALTKLQLNRQVAIVVAGKIVATPTVQGVISDGKARIGRCQDESCKTLLDALRR